ncbi:MAG: hypothetical protein ABJA98_10450 [Acidobacteriota bacterium]
MGIGSRRDVELAGPVAFAGRRRRPVASPMGLDSAVDSYETMRDSRPFMEGIVASAADDILFERERQIGDSDPRNSP